MPAGVGEVEMLAPAGGDRSRLLQWPMNRLQVPHRNHVINVEDDNSGFRPSCDTDVCVWPHAPPAFDSGRISPGFLETVLGARMLACVAAVSPA